MKTNNGNAAPAQTMDSGILSGLEGSERKIMRVCKNCGCHLLNDIQKAVGFCTNYCLSTYEEDKKTLVRNETCRMERNEPI